MYNSCRVAVICIAILSVCYANGTEQAFSSISYHRGDVPLSYNFSQIHIYSATSSERNVPVKMLIPHPNKEIEQSSNNLSVVEQNVYDAYNANVDEFSKITEHDNNKSKYTSPENYNKVNSHNVDNVETPDYTGADHQTQIETQVKENPQGFVYPKTRDNTALNNNNYYQSLPIQYYLNRLIKANLNQAPKENLNKNSLGSPYNGNQVYFQNDVRNQNIQHPYEHRYTTPTIQQNQAHSYNIATVPSKAFTEIYNVKMPLDFHERHETNVRRDW